MILLTKNDLYKADYLNGVTILVDKPIEWTSFDVVNKLRFALRSKLGIKKIKVGHAGTLDPLATGLLIIAIGRDTKMIESYQGMEKTYSGTIRLGATTQSYDSEFEPNQYFDIDHISPEMIEETRKKFTGLIEQIPPAFSALKVDGKRAYQLARKGETPVLKSRKVNIYELQFDISAFPEIKFECRCEKGTYIRSLANDIGKSLISGAYLTSLKRDAIGDFLLKDAFPLDEIIEILKKEKD